MRNFVILALYFLICIFGFSFDSPDSDKPLISDQLCSYTLILPGIFYQGSPGDETGREFDEVIHPTMITQPFFLQVTEVTQEEWEAVMGFNPSRFKSRFRPVDSVSWYSIIQFCNRKSEQEGLLPSYIITDDSIIWDKSAEGYRLPTEAEWEYAYRAGLSLPIYRGRMHSLGLNNCPELAEIAWYAGNSGIEDEFSVDSSSWKEKQYDHHRAGTHPCGQKTANCRGLFDMSGNVWEWVWDWYGDYPHGMSIDPEGPNFGTYKILRGGSFRVQPRYCRAAYRNIGNPRIGFNHAGFRCARTKLDNTFQ
jgi:formylglycine-generating enzyme